MEIEEIIKTKEEFSLTNKAGTKGVKCIICSDVDKQTEKTCVVEIVPSMISIKQIEGTCVKNSSNESVKE